MSVDATLGTLSANEAACVTGVPLQQVHRIIDIGLLGGAAEKRAGSRKVVRDGLVCIRLAHETTETLTLDGRRRLVRYLLDNPEAGAARDGNLSVDVRSMRKDVQRGLSRLARARRMMCADEAVLGGAPCIKGDAHTRARHRGDACQRRQRGGDRRGLPRADGGAGRGGEPLCPGLAASRPPPPPGPLAQRGAGRVGHVRSGRTVPDPVKFLIDECLSPSLATIARSRGFGQSTHVTWLGLRSRQDWALVRRAIRDGYVLVTNDRADFTALIERHRRHPGLICMTVAHGLMRLEVQTRLFELALAQCAGTDLTGQVLDVALTAQREVRVERYVSRAARSQRS